MCLERTCNFFGKNMYISELYIVNYRSCRNCSVVFDNDKPNILIGINDCGKSTILKAIGLLLDQKQKISPEDISNSALPLNDFKDFFTTRKIPELYYSERECIVVGKFVVEEADFERALKGSLSNHLLWGLEKTENNNLWLARVFNESTLKATDYLLTLDCLDENGELRKHYKESSSALNKAKDKLGVSRSDIENENRVGRFSNLEIIRAIYKKIELSSYWVEYKTDKEFWPEFRYLDWNISLDQLTQFTNDLLKTKIEEQLTTAVGIAKEQANKAQIVLNNELAEFTANFASHLANIESIRAQIDFPVSTAIQDFFIRKTYSDGDVQLDAQGDGLKKQLWFALIKWGAAQATGSDSSYTKYIWCFDEPETHLYPKAQRDFFDLIKEISQGSVQAIVSTHSTIFIDRADFGSIRQVFLEDGYATISRCSDIDDIYSVLKLKNSDFLFYDKFLVVEGDTEQELIPHFYKLYKGRTLFADHIQIIKLDGVGNRKINRASLNKILNGFKKNIDINIFYILDSDAYFDFTSFELREINHVFVGKQDMEDSICSSIWLRLINDLFPDLSLNINDIESIKKEIPNALDRQKTESNKKFHKLLGEHIKTLNKDDDQRKLLPAKGAESGKLLCQYIDSIELIPSEIKELFDRL